MKSKGDFENSEPSENRLCGSMSEVPVTALNAESPFSIFRHLKPRRTTGKSVSQELPPAFRAFFNVRCHLSIKPFNCGE